jgi:Cobalamin-independent synthase, Catalytic domain
MPLRVAKLTFRRRPMCATLAFASRRVISPRRTIRPFLREESAECVPFQEEVGLDVLVHGQFQHNDTVEYFGQIERLHLSVTNSFSRQPIRIRPSLPSKNIGEREVVENRGDAPPARGPTTTSEKSNLSSSHISCVNSPRLNAHCPAL